MNTAFSSLGPAVNPFALMTDPATVLAAVQRSDRLNGLRSQVFRPLDKPMIPTVDGEESGRDAFDRLIDAAGSIDD